ncbi:hypothetical protein SAVIM338S_06208 [Streptomyces avidinii]
MAAYQPARRAGAYGRPVDAEATRSWTIAPPAYATADTRQSRTERARALIESTMPETGRLFLHLEECTSQA